MPENGAGGERERKEDFEGMQVQFLSQKRDSFNYNRREGMKV